MKIKILTIGKKHELWVEQGIKQFLDRLRPPFSADMEIIPQSGKEAAQARQEESEAIVRRLGGQDFVILLDERGKNLSSPEFSEVIQKISTMQTVIIIGGAYGVTDELRERANLIWSLSKMVFPHQLVRLILAEQLYRAQEIARGGKYHHE